MSVRRSWRVKKMSVALAATAAAPGVPSIQLHLEHASAATVRFAAAGRNSDLPSCSGIPSDTPFTIQANVKGAHEQTDPGDTAMLTNLQAYFNCFSGYPWVVSINEICAFSHNGGTGQYDYINGFLTARGFRGHYFETRAFLQGPNQRDPACQSSGIAVFTRNGVHLDSYVDAYDAQDIWDDDGTALPGWRRETRKLGCHRVTHQDGTPKYVGCTTHLDNNDPSAEDDNIRFNQLTELENDTDGAEAFGFSTFALGDLNITPGGVSGRPNSLYSGRWEVDQYAGSGNQDTHPAGKLDFTFVNSPLYTADRDALVLVNSTSDHKILAGFFLPIS